MRKETRLSLLILSAFLLVGVMAVWCQYRWDNKCTAALSGSWGVSVLQADPEEPAWLVDGWEFYPGELLSPEDFAAGRQAEQYTYAGQYPNFSAQLGSPYGEATYRIVLENPGEPVELSLYLPELLCAGRVYIDGTLAGEQGSVEPYEPRVMDGVYSFTADGSTEIIIQCANYTHYYSGMYYPPAVGTPGAIARLISARLTVYGLLCFASLAAALSNLALWVLSRNRLARLLGLLCTAYALRMSYPFLRALGVPAVRPLYALEDLCAAVVLLCAIMLAGELTGSARTGYHRRAAVPAAAAMCAACVVFPVFILPHAPLLINSYGLLLSIWKLLAGVYLILLSARALRARVLLGRYLLCSAGLYGLLCAVSALTAGYLEPARGAWPEEFGGFVLVAGFAALMVRREMLLVSENRRLNAHLSEEVERKTSALETLLNERRELLAALVHDLKNPLSALRSYADLVRSSGVALDDETAACLDALSERVDAVEDRFGLLQDFSRSERAAASADRLELAAFLRGFYESNRPDIELAGQRFCLDLSKDELYVSAAELQLRAALENLCYNALSFTPPGGRITLSLRREGGYAVIRVSDTGCGIAPEDLPHVFERGFTRRPDNSGEGLGLYIVRTFALEHGGSAEAESKPGSGSTFTLRLPLDTGRDS